MNTKGEYFESNDTERKRKRKKMRRDNINVLFSRS